MCLLQVYRGLCAHIDSTEVLSYCEFANQHCELRYIDPPIALRYFCTKCIERQATGARKAQELRAKEAEAQAVAVGHEALEIESYYSSCSSILSGITPIFIDKVEHCLFSSTLSSILSLTLS